MFISALVNQLHFPHSINSISLAPPHFQILYKLNPYPSGVFFNQWWPYYTAISLHNYLSTPITCSLILSPIIINRRSVWSIVVWWSHIYIAHHQPVSLDQVPFNQKFAHGFPHHEILADAKKTFSVRLEIVVESMRTGDLILYALIVEPCTGNRRSWKRSWLGVGQAIAGWVRTSKLD